MRGEIFGLGGREKENTLNFWLRSDRARAPMRRINGISSRALNPKSSIHPSISPCPHRIKQKTLTPSEPSPNPVNFSTEPTLRTSHLTEWHSVSSRYHRTYLSCDMYIGKSLRESTKKQSLLYMYINNNNSSRMHASQRDSQLTYHPSVIVTTSNVSTRHIRHGDDG